VSKQEKGETEMIETNSSVLQSLEDEAILILRETLASFKKPVLMYSIGKDSSVLLHLCKKAFYPAPVPFPLLHIDTTWMIEFRDAMAKSEKIDLIVHTNTAGKANGVNPFTTGISEYTRVMKTVALREALAFHNFDAAIGGARRDEERSRAKERIFSVREEGYRWEPRNQRPELWNSFNTSLVKGQTMRVFPLSNWTELDIWKYIERENISVNPLYFAESRPVVSRQGQLIMVDDDRYPLKENEIPENKVVRFRTLGCYPLTAAVESTATNISDIIQEVSNVKLSERATRLIDGTDEDSMEKKKTEGYF
jgi:sulfate adenylyltransferase subunit 2